LTLYRVEAAGTALYFLSDCYKSSALDSYRTGFNETREIAARMVAESSSFAKNTPLLRHSAILSKMPEN
jgi:hypothetical protein